MEAPSILPLSEDDLQILKEIYYKRRKLLVTTFASLLFLAIICSQKIDYRSRLSDKVIKWHNKDGPRWVTAPVMKSINALFLLLPVSLASLWIYHRRIAPFRKDIRNGIKQIRFYNVTMKQYFPHTGQYFIGTDDPAYLHHEVDAAFYHQLEEGKQLAVYVAPISGYVFNKNGRYTLM